MLTIYEKKNLLKKGRNKIHVWNGRGYALDEITTDRDELSIEELAYIVIKSGKGYFALDLFITPEEEERYYYCDMSVFGEQNGFLLIENLRGYGVEIHS